MLHLFTGNDTAGAKAEARKHASGAEIILFGEGGEPFERATGFLGAQGLFTPKVAFIIDRPLETPEGQALIRNYSKTFHESDVDVFIIQPETYSQVLKNLGIKKGEEKDVFPKGVEVVEFGKQEAEERPLPFGFSDAFMRGDRKAAWMEFRKLISAGAGIEELHGTLSWAVRSALIAAKTKSAKEAGIQPFVYTKSKRFAGDMGIPAVEELSRRLVAVYHDARAGKADMELGMEKLILEKN